MPIIESTLRFLNRLYEKKVGKPLMSEIAPTSTSTSGWNYFVGNIMVNPDRVLSSSQAEGKGLELYQEMIDKDPQIASCLRTRKKAVLNKPWEIQPASDKGRDQRIAEFVTEAFNYRRQRESFYEMLDCIAKGISVCEIMWAANRDSSAIVIDDIKGRNPTRFIFDKEGKLRLKTTAAPWSGEEVPDRKFLVLRNEPFAENPYGNAILKELFWYYWGKKQAVKFWGLRMERFGSPHLKVNIPSGASDQQKQDIQTLIQTWQNQTGIAVPEGFVVELLESLSRGEIGYLPWIQYCDDQIAKSIHGQTLSSSEGRRSGSLALGEVHAETRYEYTADDSELLMDAANHQLIPWLVDYNYTNMVDYPRLVIHYEPEEDLMNEAKKDEVLFTKIGLPVGKKHLYQKYGVPEPEEDEELLEVPVRGGMPFSEKGKKKALSFGSKKKYQIGSVLKITDKYFEQIQKVIAKLEPRYLEMLEQNLPLRTTLEEIIRDYFTPEIKAALNGAHYEAIRLGAQSIADQLAMKVNKELFAGLMDDYLVRRTYEMGSIEGIADNLRSLLEGKAQPLIKGELTIEDMAGRIKKEFPEMADWKAKQIADTEISKAADYAGTQMIKKSGLPFEAWFLVDPASCDICQEVASQNPYSVAQAESYGLPHPSCKDSWAFTLKK